MTSKLVTTVEPPPKESIWAAGCVVARTTKAGKPRYLLVHRPRYDDWSLPKGKVDRGETFLHAALRELKEETGIVGKKPRLVGSIGYLTKAENAKVVRWWLTEVKKGKFKPNSEVDEIIWLSHKRATRKLNYRNDREVLDRANDMYLAKSAGMVYLVRHASAGTGDDDDPDDPSRKLDKRGKRQRRAIRDLLMAHPITRIGSSSFERCLSTVKPFSKRLGIPIEPETALAEGSHPHRLVGLIADLQEESAVLCTHGDVIADFIGHLFAEQVPMVGPMEWEKGSVWELRTVKGRVVSGRYIPPSA
ncbi:MAG: NUDIX hydrolase [Acidimicrobiia bacterium]|nr:MAG: NUDIX hydrolase [Acidimicrobiia bacterium]